MNDFWRTVIITLTVMLVVGLVLFLSEPQPTKEVIYVTHGQTPRVLRYGIFGAVKTPGYYDSDRYLRVEELAELAGGMTDEADPATANLAHWVDDGETVIIPTYSPVLPTITPLPSGAELVNLNTADLEELMTLPGIGEKKAADIIAYREENGGFTSVDELISISGISERIVSNMYDLLIVQ